MRNYNYWFLLLFVLGGAAYFIGSFSVEEVTNAKKIIRAQKKSEVVSLKLELPKLAVGSPSPDTLAEITNDIINLNNGLTYLERNDLVMKLNQETLTQNDFHAFYNFLRMPPPDEGAQLFWHSIKNDLLVFIIDDGRFKESTGYVMLEIINDENQHEVMREYTLQYITDFFERHWLTKKGEKRSSSKNDIELQEYFLESMWNVLSEPNGPVAGTSLIRLNDLSKNFSLVDEENINLATEKMLLDTGMSNSSRMAAVSVVKDRELLALGDSLFTIVSNELVNASLRMAALHTISIIDPNARFNAYIKTEFIENKEADKRLKRAAILAQKNINKNRG